ncbi:TerB N-terminal domain-containing protein [Peptoniphilus harei]|uniref:TerB N-terminal domain-containing protein n=1 Tax=Peptoniphilus harei TaxID=54005 RepID=UPI00291402CD|nr:TerB N-terminal domain-containing protein [Peptoniphilus harei]MDU5418113.1 TerB N-terminal domain-containing protein [Peptoniphilus harei]
MNRYTLLKVLCFIFSGLFAISFLVTAKAATQFAHYVIGTIIFLAPSILLLKFGLWASKKEKYKNLEMDPDYFIKKSELKKSKSKEKRKRKIKHKLADNTKISTDTSYEHYNLPDTSIEKLQEKEIDNSYNPKFHRTEEEKELDFNFYFKNKDEIEKFEKLIYSFLDSDFIEDTVKSIQAFDNLGKFCSSKGKGGKIYFEDTWLNCHNSHNACFSYRDSIIDNLYNLCEYCIELPTDNLFDYLYFESLKVDDLKNLLRENNLKLSGKKSELIDRLIENKINPIIDSETRNNLNIKEEIIRKNLNYINHNKELINSLLDEDLIDSSTSIGLPDNQKNLPEAFIKSIPGEVFNLLWFKNGPFKNFDNPTDNISSKNGVKLEISFSSDEEPSALDVFLPIKKGVDNEKIGYYPAYSDLNEVQRYQYLNWLKDINQEIDISYVFIFYYGLERYLFTDKWKDACNMIYKLQKNHSNGSFYSYSSDALLMTALKHKDISLLEMLDKEKIQPLAYASIKGALAKSFNASDIVSFSRIVGWTNKRYIDSEYDLFLSELEKSLKNTFNSHEYYVDPEEYRRINTPVTLMLANYSLNIDDRKFEIPDILSSIKIKKDLYKLLETTHNNVKIILRERRKKEKNKEI